MRGIGLRAGLGAAFALAATPSSAIAQTAPTGAWELKQTAESCYLSRTYAGGMRLMFQSFGPETPYHLTLSGPGLPLRESRSEAVQVGFGGEENAAESLGLVGKAGGVPMMVIATRFREPGHTMAWFYASRGLALGAPFDPSAESLYIDMVDMEPITLALGPMQEQYSRLDACAQALDDTWRAAASGERFAAAEPKLLDAEEASWHTKYPENLLLNRISGVAELRMTVDERGRPRDCVVQNSTWDRHFGEHACSLFMSFAHFEPARGADGQPTRALYRTVALFSIYNW